MTMFIAAIICTALFAVSIAHFVWSFGGTWPIRDRNHKLLAQTVVGTPGVEKMPPRWMSFLVAVFALAASIWAMALADPVGGGILLTTIGGALAVIFLARGILGYTPRWQALTPTEPFRTNDRRVYSPLCLVVGAGYLIMVIVRLL